MAKTYEQFKSEVLGKGFDIDGAWGKQCFDLYAYYCQCLGCKLPDHWICAGYLDTENDKRHP